MAGLEQKQLADVARAGAASPVAPARAVLFLQKFFNDSLLSPNFWLLALALVCAILLLLPIKLAIGGYYWDVYLYPDAAWRIANGQIPHVDFFTPAGALEYYTYVVLHALFPGGQHLLLAQWGLLIVSLPLMASVIASAGDRNRYLALAIVLPFVYFSFIPLNTKEVYPLAGVDGYGIYNRHVCLLLYVLVSAFIFVPAGRKLAILAGLLFSALFLTKITGAVTGLIIIVHAILAGRLRLRDAGIAALVFLAICMLIEIPTGMISAYLRDIVTLVSINSGGLLERLRSPVVMYLDILAPLLLLAALLIWIERDRLAWLISQRLGMQLRNRIATLCNIDAIWILVLVAAGILFETQNTGSLAFIFLWPLLAHLFARWHPQHRDRRTAVLLLIALATLPMLMPMLHRTARATAASLFYESLDRVNLGSYNAVEAKPELIDRAQMMHGHYGRMPDRYRSLSEAGHQSSYLLYSEIDFQLTWLIGVSEAVKALQAWEKASGARARKIITLDFVDVFTPLLRREPVRLISIGMAAERTVPPLDQRRLASAMEADSLLVPLCPVTPVRLSLMKTFEPVLAGKRRVALTDCWDLYTRN